MGGASGLMGLDAGSPFGRCRRLRRSQL
jgi:hypothetical protein